MTRKHCERGRTNFPCEYINKTITLFNNSQVCFINIYIVFI